MKLGREIPLNTACNGAGLEDIDSDSTHGSLLVILSLRESHNPGKCKELETVFLGPSHAACRES